MSHEDNNEDMASVITPEGYVYKIDERYPFLELQETFKDIAFCSLQIETIPKDAMPFFDEDENAVQMDFEMPIKNELIAGEPRFNVVFEAQVMSQTARLDVVENISPQSYFMGDQTLATKGGKLSEQIKSLPDAAQSFATQTNSDSVTAFGWIPDGRNVVAYFCSYKKS